MSAIRDGRYRVRFADGPDDLARAQALRFQRFRAEAGVPEGRDGDAFDAAARHVLVEETASGRLVCCFRVLRFRDGAEIARSYSAQFYELGKLARYPGPMLELGRFCVAAGETDPALLRLAWGALGDIVAAERIELVFGCTSFAGTDAEAYADAFALLKDRHLGPRRWLPRVKAPKVFRFAARLRLRTPDLKAALRAMPPLLRSYLAMGGWVSDHAVVDRDLGTLHVFTGLEVGGVPEARIRALRAYSA
jgi:putative hemolysin